jgi:tetratricopeptide (TPR) repeat protein
MENYKPNLPRPEPTTPITGEGVPHLRNRPFLFAEVPDPPRVFIGREDFSKEFVELMRRDSISVIAVSGPPGIGKTALAASLARSPRVLRKYEDGVLWAGLGIQGDARGALAAWGNFLGKDISNIAGLADRANEVKRLIGDRRFLLVIDDAWDLDVARALQCGTPGCLHLLTTRDELIARAFAGDQQSRSLPPLSSEAALDLLKSLAPQVYEGDVELIQRLAGACRGIPLALELLGGFLSAPEGNSHPQAGFPEDRVAKAGERFTRLKGRQDNSLNLPEILRLCLKDLPQEALTAFSELGAFAPEPDRFSREAATYVAGTQLETIELLVARRLLISDREQLAMNQLLADVACENTTQAAASRHGAFYLKLARDYQHEPGRISSIYRQIKYAWSAAPDDAGLLDWIEAMSYYQESSGLWSDYLDWAERGLRVAEQLQLTHARGILYNNLAKVRGNLGQRERALSYYHQALIILEEVGTRAEVATALSNLGTTYASQGKGERALNYFHQALPILEEVNDLPAQATLLNNLGKLYSDAGQSERALVYFQRALPILKELENYSLESTTRFNLAMLHRSQGRLEQAVAEMRQVVALEGLAGHPDLDSDSALLAQVERELATPRFLRWIKKLF